MLQHKEFKPTSWSIDNKTTIYIFTLLITLGGIFTYIKLPKERFPDVVLPTFIISTIYPGTAPGDIENMIVKPIEKQLKSINGIKKITSNSIQDFGLIQAEFTADITIPEAKRRVQDAVDKAKNDLPGDLDNDPAIQEVDLNEMPIMNVNLAGNYSQQKLKKYAEELQDAIEALPEITRVDIIGALNREIQINVNLFRMQANGITFNDIENSIKSQNINLSGGDLNVNNVRRTLRIAGEFRTLASLKELVIRGARGNTVFLSEIADVQDGFEEQQNFARLENKPVVTLNVIKRGGENLIEASDKIQVLIKDKQATTLPEGLTVTITGDQSDETRVTLNDLINTVILGFVFVVIVLMFFMGTTNAIFVGLSVPLSSLVAFLILPGFDYTLNMIVTFSFLLALGIVVDDAIVVIENTHRIFHLHPEKGIVKSAKEAAGEVFIPVLSGTLTTIAPFVPLLFWPGIIGEFMEYLPVTLIITLFASLFVAFIMNPVFAVSFMKTAEQEKAIKNSGIRQHLWPVVIIGVLILIGYASNVGVGNFFVFFLGLYFLNHYVLTPVIEAFQNSFLPALKNGYRSLLRHVIKGYRPVFYVIGCMILLVVIFMAYGASKPRVELFPQGDPNFVYVYNQMPIGTDARVTDSVTKIMEKRVFEVIGKDNQAVKSVISNVGLGAGTADNPDRVVTPHKSKVTVAFKPFGERHGINTSKILENIRAKMSGIPGAEISIEKESNGPPTGKPVNIEITGDDFTILQNITVALKRNIEKAGIKGYEELKSDLQLNKPEIVVDINKEKAQREGISTVQVALAVRTALYGKEASRYREAKDDYPIIVRLKEDNRKTIEDIMSLQISFQDFSTGAFRQVPLSSIAEVRYGTTYSQINRKNQARVVNLGSNVLQGYNANEIVQQIESVIAGMDVPSGYAIKMTGEQEQQDETSSFLGFAFLGCILLMMMILVTQFNSISKPFILFTTIILSLIGVLLGYMIFDMTFVIVMTGIGIIALAGIVVKNGILLIEFTDELRSRGYPLREAIIEAGATRLTPVLLTAAAAILGLIPLAIGLNINFATLFTSGDAQFHLGGDNAVFWGPLAWAIVFGLIFCTFLTLVMVPVQYWLIERLKRRMAGLPADDQTGDFVVPTTGGH